MKHLRRTVSVLCTLFMVFGAFTANSENLNAKYIDSETSSAFMASLFERFPLPTEGENAIVIAADADSALKLAQLYLDSLTLQGRLPEGLSISGYTYDREKMIWGVIAENQKEAASLISPCWVMGISARTGECISFSRQSTAALLAFMIASVNDSLDKESIITLVKEHQKELTSYISKGDYSDSTAIEGIRSVKEENGCVVFDCGGYGIGQDTGYVGFYFNADDTPYAVPIAPCSTDELSPENEGYGWHKSGGDNAYYTERIIEGLFYYEAKY